MARQKDIEFYQEWRLTSPMAILFIAIRRFRRVVRSVIEILSLGGLTVVLLQFLDVGLVTAILSYAAALLVFIVISAVLSYFVLRVHISNDGISMKSGVFRRIHKVVPWDKVRSVNLESGPIERLFKLSRVSVDTASSMGAEIEIPAMPIYVGTYLRRYVQEPNRSDYQEPSEDQVNQDLPGGAESTPLYSLRGENMFIAAMCAKGIMISTLIGIGVVVAILSNLFIIFYQLNIADDVATTDTTLQEEVQDTLREEIETNINLLSYFPQMWQIAAEMREINKNESTIQMLLPLLIILIGAIVILIPSLLIGFLIKSLIFFVAHKDYRLSHENTKLITEQGLITRKTTTVDIPKIQILKIHLNLRSRLFRRIDVKVQQSDEDDTIQGALGNATHQVDIPSVQSQFRDELARTVFPSESKFPPLDPRSKEIQRFSATYFFVGLLGVGPLIATCLWGLFWFLMGARGATSWILTTIPMGILVWWQYWRRTGYAFYEDFVLLRTGFLGHELRVIPITKLQEVHLSQSIIQKFRNRCSLRLFAHSTSYANALKIPFINRAFAERMRDYLLYRIESSKTRWC